MDITPPTSYQVDYPSTCVIDGKMYTFGGYSNKSSISDIYIYMTHLIQPELK